MCRYQNSLDPSTGNKLFTQETFNLIEKAKTQQIPEWELSGELTSSQSQWTALQM